MRTRPHGAVGRRGCSTARSKRQGTLAVVVATAGKVWHLLMVTSVRHRVVAHARAVVVHRQASTPPAATLATATAPATAMPTATVVRAAQVGAVSHNNGRSHPSRDPRRGGTARQVHRGRHHGALSVSASRAATRCRHQRSQPRLRPCHEWSCAGAVAHRGSCRCP